MTSATVKVLVVVAVVVAAGEGVEASGHLAVEEDPASGTLGVGLEVQEACSGVACGEEHGEASLAYAEGASQDAASWGGNQGLRGLQSAWADEGMASELAEDPAVVAVDEGAHRGALQDLLQECWGPSDPSWETGWGVVHQGDREDASGDSSEEKRRWEGQHSNWCCHCCLWWQGLETQRNRLVYTWLETYLLYVSSG